MIAGSKITLRDKRLADARDDYAWRIDPELAHLDAAAPLTTTFPEYLSDYNSNGYGTDAVTTLVNYIFQQTSLKRIHLKTLDSNSRAQKCFKKCGFTPYGRRDKDGFSFMLMELYREQWEKSRQNPEATL